MSITEIACALNKNKHSVGHYLNNLLISGHVEMRTYGKAKVFSLSSRIPLNSLMGYAHDLILVLDRDQRIVRINDQFLSLVKKTQSEVLNKNPATLSVTDQPAQTIFSSILSCLESGVFKKILSVKNDKEQIFCQKILPTVFEDGKQGTIILLEDITKRKAAESLLRTSEEQFRLMADNIQDGIVIYENENAVYTNRRVEEIFGYSKEELATRSPIDLAAPEERTRVMKIIDECSASGTLPSSIMFWIIRKDHTRRYISNRITSIERGESLLRYITITDMTEWKQAQDGLIDQLAFLQNMIDTFPNPLFYIDPQGRYLGCNSAFETLTGKKFKEIAGKTNGEIGGSWQADILSKDDAELLKRLGIVTYKGILYRTNGQPSNVTIQKSTLHTVKGSLAGIVGFIFIDENF
ncbi:MAG: PAS domain S-box protein [Methanoregula sp.]|nr:PAS domain S-box protein [Methanoregula sp.]